MNELEGIFKACDAMFAAADTDYNDLASQTLDSHFFEDYQNVRILNSFLFNYAKLQDKIGARLVRKLLYALKEIDRLDIPMIDLLNTLEQLGFIEDVSQWDELREIRNVLAHEYPEAIQERLDNIHLAFRGYGLLKEIYARLKSAWGRTADHNPTGS